MLQMHIPCSSQILWSRQQLSVMVTIMMKTGKSGAFESRKIQREVFSPLYNCAPPDKEAIVVRVMMMIPDFANFKL